MQNIHSTFLMIRLRIGRFIPLVALSGILLSACYGGDPATDWESLVREARNLNVAAKAMKIEAERIPLADRTERAFGMLPSVIGTASYLAGRLTELKWGQVSPAEWISLIHASTVLKERLGMMDVSMDEDFAKRYFLGRLSEMNKIADAIAEQLEYLSDIADDLQDAINEKADDGYEGSGSDPYEEQLTVFYAYPGEVRAKSTCWIPDTNPDDVDFYVELRRVPLNVILATGSDVNGVAEAVVSIKQPMFIAAQSRFSVGFSGEQPDNGRCFLQLTYQRRVATPIEVNAEERLALNTFYNGSFKESGQQALDEIRRLQNVTGLHVSTLEALNAFRKTQSGWLGALPRVVEMGRIHSDTLDQMLEMGMMYNLQLLELQNALANESREYSVVSNVLKARHDVAMASIRNVR